jgi:YcxB-like protein
VSHLASYTFSLGDYKTLVRAVQSRSRLGRWSPHIVIAVVMFVVSLFGLVGGSFETGRLPGWAAASQAIAIWLAVTAFMLATLEVVLRLSLFQRMGFKRLSVADRAMAYELGAQGVSWTRDGMSGAFDWSTIEAAVVDPTAIVLLISRHEGVVLPLRAFPSQAEFDAAVQFAQANIPSGTSRQR